MDSNSLGRELVPIAIMILMIVMTFVWTADLVISIDMPRVEFFEVVGNGSLGAASGTTVSGGADIEQPLH